MAVRIRYARTELSEGVVEVLHEVDKFSIHEDNSVELRGFNPDTNKYRIIGWIHPMRWESIVILDEAGINNDGDPGGR